MDIEVWLKGLPSQEQKRKRSTVSAMDPDASDAGSDTGSKRRRLESGNDITALDARLTLRRPPRSQEGLSGQSSSSRNRSRRGSPTRSMADLASAVPPIIGCEIDPIETRLPKSAPLLRGKIMAFETLQGIFPACLQTQIVALLGRAFENQIYYCDDGSLSEDDEHPVTIGVENLYVLILVLTHLTNSLYCLLGLQQRSRLVSVDAYDRSLEFKKVDYGFFLALGPDGHIHVRKKLQSLDPLEQSVNQTMAGYVRNRPLVMFLELKKPNSESDPLVQLGVWSSALPTRLRLLSLKDAIDLLPLPVLQVVGHDWKVYYLHRDDSGAVVLHGPQVIGSTLSIQGIYQIIKVLGATADYAVDEYWPWFENNML
ncbi:MAG: hypothetical protein M1840_002379 [Geoglossum simile]|nr:MAG: hypothetical protein M1840_002379 [Geoglossum simile]